MKRLPAITRGNRFALFALIITQAMVLLRSALIARALGPEQYGIAATFILLQQFLDSASDTGLNKFVLSHARGHHRTMLATVHAIAVSRSAIMSLLLLAVAWPVFRALDLATSVLPFILLAAATLAVGLTQFDGQRMQRSGDFSAASLGNLLSEVIATITAAALVLVDQTYIVAIYVILAKAASVALLSFLLARRPYRIAFHRPSAAAVWAYSLPLFINGPLLFLSGQADRLVAATLLMPEELGVYTAALLLIYTPSQLFARYLGTIFLPEISREVRETGRHGPRFALVTVTAAAAMATGFAVAGQWLIVLIFGPAYRLDWLIVCLIGLTQTMRFSRVWSSGLALVPLCLVGVWAIGGMKGLAIGALAGEAVALAYANWAVKRALGRRAASPPGERPVSATSDLPE